MKADRWSLVSEIYAGARERAPAIRATFLDESCRGDEALRAEVEALLAHDLPSTPAFDVVAAGLASAAYPHPGATLGSYRLVELIGEGGMGQVYRAHDAELGRDVAIKFLAPLYASDPDRRARFHGEARVLASVNHPHVGAIYGVADWGDFRGLVLELVEGDTLADRLAHAAGAKTGLPLLDAVAFAIEIAEALEAAHAKGIVHRDLKPSNIKIGVDGRVKVLDFGLAKAVGDAGAVPGGTFSPDGGSHEASVIAGTGPYMSPEQRQGHAVDQRTDVWAFGCVLYEMLCGRRAFVGKGEPSAGQNRGPDWTALPRNTPVDLSGLLRRLLEPDPTRRTSTMTEARGVLERCLTGLRGSSRRPAYALLVAAAVAVVAAVIFGAWRWTSTAPLVTEPTIDAIAVLPLRNLTGDDGQEYLTDGTTEAVIASLAQVRSLDVTTLGSVLRLKDTKDSLPAIASRLGVDAVVDGSLQRIGGRIRVSARVVGADGHVRMPSRDFEADESDLLPLQVTVARTIADEIRAQLNPEERQRLLNPKPVRPDAYTEYLLGRHNLWKLDEGSLRAAIVHFERAIAIQPDYARAYAELAMAHNALQNFGMEDTGPEAREAAQKALALDPDLAEVQMAAGVVAFGEWDWNSAVTRLTTAREMNPNSVETCSCFAPVLSALGRHAEAISLIDHAVKLDPLVAVTHFQAGLIYSLARRYVEAERHLRLSLDLQPEQYPAPIVLADVMVATGRPQEAVQVLDRPPFLRSAFMAAAYAAAGRRREATSLLDEVTKSGRLEYLNIARAYLSLGNRERAFEWLEKAMDERQGYMRWAAVNPLLETLHGDPRFQALIARLKLPPT